MPKFSTVHILTFSLCNRQYDLRESSKRSEVLIDLTEFCGQLVEAKCLAINPRDNNYLAVGANGPFVRLYDIRMIHNYRLVPFSFILFCGKDYSTAIQMCCVFYSLTGKVTSLPRMSTRSSCFFTQEIFDSEHISSCSHIL